MGFIFFIFFIEVLCLPGLAVSTWGPSAWQVEAGMLPFQLCTKIKANLGYMHVMGSKTHIASISKHRVVQVSLTLRILLLLLPECWNCLCVLPCPA